MQNFKMSASEYLRCAPKYTISGLNNQIFPPRRGGHPSPHPIPLGTFGASLLAPSALVPPLKNPGYAPVRLHGTDYQKTFAPNLTSLIFDKLLKTHYFNSAFNVQ